MRWVRLLYVDVLERTWCSLIDHNMARCGIGDLSSSPMQGVPSSQIGEMVSSQIATERLREELTDDTNGQGSISVARGHVGWLEAQKTFYL